MPCRLPLLVRSGDSVVRISGACLVDGRNIPRRAAVDVPVGGGLVRDSANRRCRGHCPLVSWWSLVLVPALDSKQTIPSPDPDRSPGGGVVVVPRPARLPDFAPPPSRLSARFGFAPSRSTETDVPLPEAASGMALLTFSRASRRIGTCTLECGSKLFTGRN